MSEERLSEERMNDKFKLYSRIAVDEEEVRKEVEELDEEINSLESENRALEFEVKAAEERKNEKAAQEKRETIKANKEIIKQKQAILYSRKNFYLGRKDSLEKNINEYANTPEALKKVNGIIKENLQKRLSKAVKKQDMGIEFVKKIDNTPEKIKKNEEEIKKLQGARVSLKENKDKIENQLADGSLSPEKREELKKAFEKVKNRNDEVEKEIKAKEFEAYTRIAFEKAAKLNSEINELKNKKLRFVEAMKATKEVMATNEHNADLKNIQQEEIENFNSQILEKNEELKNVINSLVNLNKGYTGKDIRGYINLSVVENGQLFFEKTAKNIQEKDEKNTNKYKNEIFKLDLEVEEAKKAKKAKKAEEAEKAEEAKKVEEAEKAEETEKETRITRVSRFKNFFKGISDRIAGFFKRKRNKNSELIGDFDDPEDLEADDVTKIIPGSEDLDEALESEDKPKIIDEKEAKPEEKKEETTKRSDFIYSLQFRDESSESLIDDIAKQKENAIMKRIEDEGKDEEK